MIPMRTPSLAGGAATWDEWAFETLAGIGAPGSSTALVALRYWSATEKGAAQSIQWNNPLNTTEKWPGSRADRL